MPLNKIITFLIICVILPSCKNILNQSETPLELQLENPSQQDTTEAASVDFESVKKLVFAARCTSCHQQYNNYQGVLREIGAIEASIKNRRMPKSGGPLSENQQNLLFQWISNGAPNLAGAPVSTTPPAPLEPLWKSISENVFIPKCLVCHNSNGQAKFLDLSTRQNIYDKRNRVFGTSKFIDLDSPAQSYLVEVLQDDEEPMPPVWSNIPRLSPKEIEILKQWIGLGLP